MNMLPAITPSQARLPQTYEAAREKAAWVDQARHDFAPGPRKECEVCGQWKGLAQAHHIFPLAEQFDDGVASPDQAFAWLCPNHHAAVHLLMSQIRGKRVGASRSVINVTNELYARGELERLLDLAAKRFPELLTCSA